MKIQILGKKRKCNAEVTIDKIDKFCRLEKIVVNGNKTLTGKSTRYVTY